MISLVTDGFPKIVIAILPNCVEHAMSTICFCITRTNITTTQHSIPTSMGQTFDLDEMYEWMDGMLESR